MANKKGKSAAQQAAEQQAAAQAAPAAETTVTLPTTGNPQTKGLTQGEKVAYIGAIQTERQFMMNNTEKPSQDMIEGFTLLAQAAIIDVAIGEIACGVSATGRILSINEANYEVVRKMALERGVRLPEFKALPAPTEEQMKAAGVQALTADTKAIVIKKEDVSEKAVKDKKKEIEAVKNAVENPAEVQNEEQLKASLTALLVKPIANGPDGIDARVSRTVKFYRGYLTIQANKIEDAEEKKAKLAALKDVSMVDLLTEISELVGPCPFVLHGGAYILRKQIAQTGDPLSAFCLYRRTATSVKDGSADDQQIADIVRALTTWSCKSVIADMNKNVKDAERIIKKNEDDAKGDDKNKAAVAKSAIKTWQNKIDNEFKPKIAEMETLIDNITNPSFDIVDGIVENYNAEEEKPEVYALTRRMVGEVMRTYYKGTDTSKVEEASMLANAKQRAGVILNMFRSPLNQNQSYSEANISELKMIEEAGEKKNKLFSDWLLGK